jgi:hypothetical protein
MKCKTVNKKQKFNKTVNLTNRISKKQFWEEIQNKYAYLLTGEVE